MAEALLATVALGAIALAAAGFLAQRLRVPPALGYLAAGLALSPHTINRHFFNENIVDGIAEVGVLFLLFLIGLELDLRKLRKVLRSTAWVMPFDLLLPMVMAGGAARLAGWSITQSFALGAAVALSSTLLGERITSPPKFGTDARTRVLGVLVAEDVAAGALLASLAIVGSGVDAGSLGVVAFDVGKLLFLLILLTGLAILVVPRILDTVARRHVHELVVLWGIGIVMLWGYLGAKAGSAELGAFVAGVAAAEAGSRFVARNAMHSIRDAAVAVFFFASGLAADVLPVLAAPWLALSVAGLFLAGKVAVHIPASVAAGLPFPAAVRTAFALGTLGEFSLVLAAVAVRNGIAHPMLQATIVVAMIIVLPIASLLVESSDRIARQVDRLPRRILEPLNAIAQSMRRTRVVPTDPSKRRQALRSLFANLIILAAWLALVAWGVTRIVLLLPQVHEAWVQIGYWGVALAIAVPLLRSTLRAYRNLVWLLVGLQPGERVGAGKVRVRIIDTLVALTALPILALVSFSLPAAWPILAIGAVIAAGVAAIAWRHLSSFQAAMEEAMGRVLGNDPAAGRVLDHVLREYPWGVRSIAVAVPSKSPVVGRTIRDSGIASLSGAMVAVVQRRGKELVGPAPDERLLAGDTLVLMGDAHQLERAEALVVSTGEALGLAAHTMDASVEDIPIVADMPCIGRTLGELQIRELAGALIVGHWALGGHRPRRFQPGRILQQGDRLLLLGTPMQIQRAHDLLSAPVDEEE